MSQRADKIFEGAGLLSPDESAILALQLLDTVGESEPIIEEAWRHEIRRRLADIDSGGASFSSWDDARMRIFARD